MIFVTVGLHHQGFERLVRKIDDLAGDRLIENVFIQTGHTDFSPRYCKWKDFISYDIMKKLIRDSEIIITHAGAGTIMTIMKEGKLPIIVPRRKEFNEHNNNHQLDLADRVEKFYGAIVVRDIDKLNMTINNYLEKGMSFNHKNNFTVLSILQEFINSNIN